MGKLFVIDGLDGCGKTAQLVLLDEHLVSLGIPYRQISFPDYAQPSSSLVKLYLNGDLGGSVNSVNAYAASSFYAVDRYASYKQFWEKDYQKNVPIVAARYTTSNIIHQMAKLPSDEWESFLKWLEEYEYDKLGLPRPDAVVFLDMPLKISQQLLRQRYHGDESKKDIHEKDMEYLACCHRAAMFAAKRCGWIVLPCSDGVKPLPPTYIHQALFETFREVLQKEEAEA